MSEQVPEDTRFVTREQFAQYLRLTPENAHTVSALLDEDLDTALAAVVRRLGPLQAAEAPYEVYSTNCSLILERGGFTAVGTVTDPDGNVVPVDRLDVDAAVGIVRVPRAVPGTWTVRATNVQHDAATLKSIVKIIASHLWDAHGGGSPEGGRRFTRPVVDGQPAPRDNRRGFAFPARAEDLVNDLLGAGGGFA